ncbi:MAG: hydantoinase B/oxoprolinase family protein [Anaerolineae bacterium]
MESPDHDGGRDGGHPGAYVVLDGGRRGQRLWLRNRRPRPFLAHATRSMPVFNRTLPTVTDAFIRKIGLENMRPGDVFITNDPWLSAGHSLDIAAVDAVLPRRQGHRLYGQHRQRDRHRRVLNDNLARESYEEGLIIPMAYLIREGQVNDLVLEFVRWNVRAGHDYRRHLRRGRCERRRARARCWACWTSMAWTAWRSYRGRSRGAPRRRCAAPSNSSRRASIATRSSSTRSTFCHLKATVIFDGREVTVDYAGLVAAAADGRHQLH